MLMGGMAYWMAQLVGWTAYCSLIIVAVYTSSPEKLNARLYIGVFTLIVFGILVTHLQRWLILKYDWLNKKLGILIPRLIVSSLASGILITTFSVFAGYIIHYDTGVKEPVQLSNFVLNAISFMTIVLFWNAIYFTYHYFQKSRKQEVENLELESVSKESELKNLRSQLNPHFLFNSLNSIRALVDIEPAKAKTSITTLSNLLRRSLVLGKETEVDMRSELEMARSYLDLEKVRFEERLQVTWEIDPDVFSFRLPPFVVQMMVENAVKHGISKLKEGGEIYVKAFGGDGIVIVQVINSGTLGEEVDLGVGIKNTRQRLALQYGTSASFSLDEYEGKVRATIQFKTRKNLKQLLSMTNGSRVKN